ncbi:hypothetical protein [Mycobacterium genavense]|uniref:hypothetical protein n=1 Tax=Mycobacterium genavense TaxID=36812 RepID=UPI00046E96B1|nr:hypothetical protein [Mycobacterium genavense]
METTQHGDDGNSAAWDFGDNPEPESDAHYGFDDGFGRESGSFLDFGDETGHDNAEPSLIDSLVESAPAADAGGELIDALVENDGDVGAADAGDDDGAMPTAKVTNPPETVSVTATMDGRISLVELSPDAAKMTESSLAAEIFAIGDLARQRALSIQHSFVLDAFRHLGISDREDEEFITDALQTGMTQLRSPDQAIRVQADVFATRYGSND